MRRGVRKRGHGGWVSKFREYYEVQKEKKKGAIEREERARRTREREKVNAKEERERQTKRKKGNAARGEGRRGSGIDGTEKIDRKNGRRRNA